MAPNPTTTIVAGVPKMRSLGPSQSPGTVKARASKVILDAAHAVEYAGNDKTERLENE